MFRKVMECSGRFWNVLECHGIFWKVMEHHGRIKEHDRR
jgi:hypothetical protein